MKNRIIKGICGTILFINFLLLVGLTGACEMDRITIKEYIIKSVIIIVCSIVPTLISRLFEDR